MQFWYRYHTNWYRYQHAIFVGFKRNFDLGARARLSFDPTSRSLRWIVFKPTLGQNYGSSCSRVFSLIFGVFLIFSRVS